MRHEKTIASLRDTVTLLDERCRKNVSLIRELQEQIETLQRQQVIQTSKYHKLLAELTERDTQAIDVAFGPADDADTIGRLCGELNELERKNTNLERELEDIKYLNNTRRS